MELLGEKQKVVLEMINKFGVITATQLVEILKGKVSHVTVYTAKKKLVKMGFIFEEKIGYQLILSMRPSGVSYLGSTLTAFTKVNYTLLKHQLLMNDCILALRTIANSKEYAFDYLTERELRSNYLEVNFTAADRKNTTKLKKVPDSIPDFVVTENTKKTAYEVEITQKSKLRYKEKVARYKDEILSGEYDEISYLCESKQIRDTVFKYALEGGLVDSEGNGDITFQLVGRLLKNAGTKNDEKSK